VILNQIEPRDARIAYLLERNFPFVTHGRSDWCREHPYFDFDNTRFGEIAMEELARRGRRNVLLVAPPMVQNYAQNLHDGVSRVAAARGIRFQLLLGATSTSANAAVEAAVGAALACDPTIDAAITTSTIACVAVVAAAEDAGRVIGDDLDLFSKESLPFLKRFRRGILSVHEDVATAGAFLARAAMQRIAEPGRPPMQGLETPRF
jgi:LacI family transcriptional regulator